LLGLVDGPTIRDGESAGRTDVIGCVNGFLVLLALLVAGVAAERQRCEGSAPHVLGVFDMYVDARAKCGFEVFIVGLPRHHLRIGAAQVGVEYNVAVVWDEELTNVWKYELRHRRCLSRCRSGLGGR
jgi:hypothetical protein